MADEVKTPKKAPKKQATVVKPVASEKSSIKYYFPKSAKKSYRTNTINLKADNHIYVLDPENPKYDAIKQYLQTHAENKANGGRVFTELSDGIGKDSDRGTLLDKLLVMNTTQLRRICGDAMELQAIVSKGQLIDLYLTQQNL